MDSTDASGVASRNLTAYNFSGFAKIDTVPSSNDTIPKKDSTDTSGVGGRNLTAYNFSGFATIDTVPSSNDTIPKKDSTDSLKSATANLSSNVNLYLAPRNISLDNSGVNSMKSEAVYAVLPITEK